MQNNEDALFDNLALAQLWQRRSYKWARYSAPVIPAWVAEMDYPIAPELTAALQDLVDRSDWGYPPHAEYLSLGKTFAHWAQSNLAWPVEAQSVLPLADALKGMELVLRTEVPTGSGVVIMPPVYYPFFSLPVQAGHEVVEVPLQPVGKGWQMDLDRLESAFKGRPGQATVRALLLCHPHNPTGTVFSDAQLQALAQLCMRHGVTVISDEVHGLLELQQPARWRPYSTYHPDAESVYTVTSAAKAWNLAGLKTGVLIAHGQRARERLAALPHRFKSGASLPGLVTLEAALLSGNPWLERCKTYLRARSAQITEAVATWPLEVAYAPPQAGYLAWLHLPELGRRLSPDDSLHAFFLRNAQVAVSDGSEFGKGYTDWVRLNFATSRAVLDTLLDRLARSLELA